MVVERLRRMMPLLPVLAVAILTVSCDYLASPLPGFLSGIEQNVTISPSANVTEVVGEVRFELAMVGDVRSADRRLLVKAEAVSNDPTQFSYGGELIIFTPDLVEERRLLPESELDFLSRPYGYGHDGNLMVGYSVYGTDSERPIQVLDPRHGLEGFITVDTALPSTHLIAAPGGQFSAFHLEIRSYQQPAPNWALLPRAEQLAIEPDGVALSANPQLLQSGYQLLGIARSGPAGDTLLLLLSRPSEQLVVGASIVFAEALDPSVDPRPVLLPDASARLFTIDADRPRASVDEDGFFLLRRNGWFERYDWQGQLEARVTGDTSFTRSYTFDYEEGFFYRFDSQTRVLSRIRGWW